MKRYQIFISSTFQDLVEERKSVASIIQKMGHIPAGMEWFPADSKDSWAVIEREIDLSDYYVLIIAGRYGTVTDEGISFTEKEYNYARSKGIPIFAFIYPDRNDLLAKNVEQNAKKKFDEFQKIIEKNHNRQSWKSKEELAASVAATLSTQFNLLPRSGWVRGDIESATAQLQEHVTLLMAKNVELERDNLRLKERLESASTSRERDNASLASDTEKIDVGIECKLDDKSTVYIPINYTWIELFRLISPKILTATAVWRAIEPLEKDVKKKVIGVAPGNIVSVSIPNDSKDLIRNQFLALDLITVTKQTSSPVNMGPRIMHVPGSEVWQLTSRGVKKYTHDVAVKTNTGWQES